MARSTTSAAASKSPEPWVIGHRGASATCPENTFAAFDEALRQGADGLEMDLQLSSDETVVIHHDATLAKLAADRRRITQCTARELTSTDAGSWFHPRHVAERIPTLSQVLDRYGGRTRLMLELKVDGHSPRARRRLAELTTQALRERGLEPAAHLLSFDAGVLRQAGRLLPGVPLVLDVSERPLGSAELARLLRGIDVLCFPARHVSHRLVQWARGRNVRVWTYRCDTDSNLHRAAASGVEAIITDRPAWARRRLAARSAPKP